MEKSGRYDKWESEEGIEMSESKVKEERITLNMPMEDYGYVINTLKSIQINLAGTNIATTRMSIGVAGSLNILERSQVDA